MSPRIKQACTLQKVHNKPLKYQTTIWMRDLDGLTKTTTVKSIDREAEQEQVSKDNNSMHRTRFDQYQVSTAVL